MALRSRIQMDLPAEPVHAVQCPPVLGNGQWHFWPVNQHLMTADDYDWRYETRVYRKAGVLLPQSQQEYGEFYSRVTPQLGPAHRWQICADGWWLDFSHHPSQELPQDQTLQGL